MRGATDMSRTLTPQERRSALRRARQRAGAQRLRRVRLACHGWTRDPDARVGDWLWCPDCADLRRVSEVAE
jgi:hypothetical protein